MSTHHSYKYPKIQTVIRGTVFIMTNVFDSNVYNEYEIRFQQGKKIETGRISHDAIKTYINQNICIRKSVLSFANGAPFVKIPILCLKISGKDNMPLKQLSLIPEN